MKKKRRFFLKEVLNIYPLIQLFRLVYFYESHVMLVEYKERGVGWGGGSQKIQSITTTNRVKRYFPIVIIFIIIMWCL